jgi:hypothetical protein
MVFEVHNFTVHTQRLGKVRAAARMPEKSG